MDIEILAPRSGEMLELTCYYCPRCTLLLSLSIMRQISNLSHYYCFSCLSWNIHLSLSYHFLSLFAKVLSSIGAEWNLIKSVTKILAPRSNEKMELKTIIGFVPHTSSVLVHWLSELRWNIPEPQTRCMTRITRKESSYWLIDYILLIFFFALIDGSTIADKEGNTSATRKDIRLMVDKKSISVQQR